MNEGKVTLECQFSDDFITKLKQLGEVHQNRKYIVRADYSNKESIQIEGYFKINIHNLFKKRKCEKKYKYFKTKEISLNQFEFVGKGW